MYAAFDIETSGLKIEEPRRVDYLTAGRFDVLSIGVVLMDEQLNVVEEINERARPIGRLWDNDSESIHGIKKREAMGGMEPVLLATNILAVIPDDTHFICHARPEGAGSHYLIDRAFLLYWFLYCGLSFEFYRKLPSEKVISTIHLRPSDARQFWGVERQNLAYWMDFLGIENTNHHDALFDAQVCSKVFKYQFNKGAIYDHHTRSTKHIN